MVDRLAELMTKLEPDAWRKETDFSPKVKATIDAIHASRSAETTISALNDWISKNQPCLFGRIAAKQSAITYCLIEEEMLYGDESKLEKHIQEARLKWTAAGFVGSSSNFVIAVLSPKLAVAVPGDTVKQIALRIGSLYLKEKLEPDRIYLDRLWLQQPGSLQVTWEWLAGVNYFSAQGDGRWWQDHRFPAGMAFSVNSVGHMVKSGKLTRAIQDLEETMGTAFEEHINPKVDSLDKALELAMLTIGGASHGPSGKATYLVPEHAVDSGGTPACPMKLPPSLSGTDHCSYRGYYHTDYTVPSEYFLPDVTRPANIQSMELDFTYLFDKSLDNPDHDRMGEGRRIRSSEPRETAGHYPASKRLRGVETEVRVDDAPRLQEALRAYSPG